MIPENINIVGGYNDSVLLQISLPKIIDVSTEDYNAEKVNINTALVDNDGDVRPFVLCHNEAVTLKVITWAGTEIIWSFLPGAYPMLLRAVLTDAANTATTIQIGY